MKQPLLSILVSVYNLEDQVGRLIDSIEKQNFDDYELVIVNDGSTDNTKKVVEKYMKKNKNIKLVNKENTGICDTRNIGLKNCTGKYVTLADADDYYCDNFFEVVVPHLKKGDIEMLIFNGKVMNYDKYSGSQINQKYKSCDFTEENGVIKYLTGEFNYRLTTVPWNKIYLNEVIQKYNVNFGYEKRRGGDIIFNIGYVARIKKYRYINEELYVYFLNYNILTSDLHMPNMIENSISFYDPIEEICKSSNIEEYERYMGLFYLRRFPRVLINQANSNDRKNGLKRLKEYINNPKIKNAYKHIKLKDLDFKLFISFLMLKFYHITYNIFYLKKGKKKDEK